MANDELVSRGIFVLPNEILLSILDTFPSRTLVELAPTCHQFHTLVLRLIHNRLQTAAGLDGHALYFKCHHPSAELTAPKMFCGALGTDGLERLLSAVLAEESHVGQLKTVFGLYSRFRPERHAPSVRFVYKPESRSRTYSQYLPKASEQSADGRILETVTVDAHDLFSQLSTAVLLGKREPERGILVSMHYVSQGVLRVWREWLSKHCESRSWTDGEAVVVHQEPLNHSRARAESVADCSDPTKDPSILWLGDQKFGLKLRVKERKLRNNMPSSSNDVEVAVSYVVEFEEVLVRTSHLLLKLEDAQECMDRGTGKAIVFGSYRGGLGAALSPE